MSTSANDASSRDQLRRHRWTDPQLCWAVVGKSCIAEEQTQHFKSAPSRLGGSGEDAVSDGNGREAGSASAAREAASAHPSGAGIFGERRGNTRQNPRRKS